MFINQEIIDHRLLHSSWNHNRGSGLTITQMFFNHLSRSKVIKTHMWLNFHQFWGVEISLLRPTGEAVWISKLGKTGTFGLSFWAAHKGRLIPSLVLWIHRQEISVQPVPNWVFVKTAGGCLGLEGYCGHRLSHPRSAAARLWADLKTFWKMWKREIPSE